MIRLGDCLRTNLPLMNGEVIGQPIGFALRTGEHLISKDFDRVDAIYKTMVLVWRRGQLCR